ncbi:ATP-dependent DNA helicase RecG [Myxococcus hansupus]|uniref:ATP-dependent DNA helicase RecG n=1 Tax=Pseudomyxococcus hansupus TaxID=1297742 RepID=A0A0H4XEP3_9BACT|nr:ATP-dependent DNA helicase RecG [Myxococcus hansupus]AKQ66612.1 ATP-dependent DNA helicase RecG [Myxococcus hansupus]
MSHPLASLVGPLRYACQRDFAMLATVKSLRPVLERALAGASGVDAKALAHLQAALPYVDHPIPERRKAALRRVVAGLKISGVELPGELLGMSMEGEAPPRPTSAQGGAPAGGVTPPGYVPPWRSVDPVPASRGTGGSAASSEGRRPRDASSSEAAGLLASPRSADALRGPRETPMPGAAVAYGQRVLAGALPNRQVSAPARGAAHGPVSGARGPAPLTPSEERMAPPARPTNRVPARAEASDVASLPARSTNRVPARPGASEAGGAQSSRGKSGGRQGTFDTGPGAVPGAKTRKEKAQRKKKQAVAAEASRSEAKLLSIAPRSGPLSSPLKTLGKRLGPKLVSTLDKKGLRRMGDILFMLPRCYEDRRQLRTIAELEPGERGVTVGIVKVADFVPGRQGRRMFRAVVGDRSGSIAATYFNAGPWLKSRFTVGKRIVLSGEVRATMTGREMAHPEIEPAEDLDSTTSVHFNRIVPVYPGFERGEQRSFRELTSRVGEQFAHELDDPLPMGLRHRMELMGLPDALRYIHFPPGDADLEALDAHQSPAHRRLAFDELFFLQLGMALKRQGVKAEVGIAFDVSAPRLEKARGALPFQLTGAQARVVEELCHDMARAEPMNRLVQGDVGSGKTAVAMVSALIALQAGYQVAVMAPTEILAEQHERNFRKVMAPLGYQVGLVSAAGTAKSKRQVREAVARGDIHLAVGTHALLQADVSFDRLGLVVIDEQHRFGVLQRHTLMSKGPKPDVLVMTATPIPRTLAMTLYGDLDLSVIDQLPPGRTPIRTRVFNDKQRALVYESVGAELAKGHQAYVVYPLVEESEKLDLEDATRGLEKLRKVFPDAKVGLLHGRMKAEEKDTVMEDFREKRLHLLVCTTVVEVGVDVPNASVMVVESAERFGLSQLHQLRGRVGRGAAASFCHLVAGNARSWESAERLAVMEQSSDGFVIAEKDLEIRGPGEFLGTRQSGLPELAVANLARDGDLLSMAQSEARRILEKDPDMKAQENQGLVKALEERWEGRLALARVG